MNYLHRISILFILSFYALTVFSQNDSKQRKISMQKADYAKKVFERLSTLVGKWKGVSSTEREFGVFYELISSGSVLSEKWSSRNSWTALTLYHLDGKKLIATHYCPLGNQPRLELDSNQNEQKFVFNFVSATNLQDKDAAHQHQFEIQIESLDKFWRGEIYLENGKLESEGITYHRIK